LHAFLRKAESPLSQVPPCDDQLSQSHQRRLWSHCVSWAPSILKIALSRSRHTPLIIPYHF